MSTTTTAATPNTLNSRVLEEGYGAEAWHGPNLKAALTDVSPELASWRPAAGRHSIAEIAIHHAYYAHAVRGRLSETPPEPFVFDGEDWFSLSGANALSWKDVLAVVDTHSSASRRSSATSKPGGSAAGCRTPNASPSSLGITCHAVYHAGQVQLIKRLHARD